MYIRMLQRTISTHNIHTYIHVPTCRYNYIYVPEPQPHCCPRPIAEASSKSLYFYKKANPLEVSVSLHFGIQIYTCIIMLKKQTF